MIVYHIFVNHIYISYIHSISYIFQVIYFNSIFPFTFFKWLYYCRFFSCFIITVAFFQVDAAKKYIRSYK